MNAFTMNHLSVEQINTRNAVERKVRQHHEHTDVARFIVSLLVIVGIYALAIALWLGGTPI